MSKIVRHTVKGVKDDRPMFVYNLSRVVEYVGELFVCIGLGTGGVLLDL